jgi:hypothetical protein
MKSAPSERDTRVAVYLAEAMRNALDLLDDQSPATREPLLELSEERQQAGAFSKHRRELREAFIKYVEEYSLKEARARPENAASSTVLRGLKEPDPV